MAFPSTPLPIVAGIAPGANPVDPAGWNFTEISDDVRSAGGVSIQVGRQDESDDVDATQVRATIDNRSGDYSRVNPLGVHYGQLAKGTPIDVAVTRINDTFSRTVSDLGTDADSGLTWSVIGSGYSTNGSAALAAIAGADVFVAATVAAGGHDVDVTHVSSLSAVTTGAAWVDATLIRYIDEDNYYRLHTEFATDGTIKCKITKRLAGVSTNLASPTSTGVSYSAGTVIKTRVRAVGSRLQIRAWLNSGSEPTTWTCEADDTEVTGTDVGLYEWRVAGNTNVGTLTATIDNFRSDVIRAITPVPEWPVRWDQSGRDVTTPISGAGILRRLSQGQAALRSPMRRQLPLWNPAAFWPLEDGADATAAASAVARVPAAACSDVTFGADGPPGASAAITLNNDSSSIRGTCGGPNTATGYAGMFMFKLAAIPGSDKTLALFSATGTVTLWQIVSAAAGSVKVNGYAADGSSVVTSSPITWVTDPTQWSAMRLQVTVSGGTVTWAIAWNQIGNGNFYGSSGSYSGTAPKMTGWTGTGAASTTYSMAWLGANTLPFDTADFYSVETGFAGETAADRIVRLCDEEGVPLALVGDASTSAPMGAQRSATLLDLLRECEDADQGVLHERGAGLGYLTRVARYNPATAMELDFTSGHIAAPPEPTDDDQRLRNQIILGRTGGSAVTAQDDASIAVNGTYSDELTVNLQADYQLDDHAWWRLHLGTLDDLRWPRIELDLARNPSMIASWCQVRIGSRVTIANPPDAVAGADLDLIVEGWTETLTDYGWDVVLVCSPASAWTVGVYDDGNYRYDSDSTTLGSSVSSSATPLAFSGTDRMSLWDQTDIPYDVLIAGERYTVAWMSSVGSVGALDGGFETGLTGWTPNGFTGVQSTTFAHTGTYSVQLTVTGSPGTASIFPATQWPVTVGASYTATAWVYATSPISNVRISISWYTSGGSFVSSSNGSTVALGAGAWTLLTVTATAPATGVLARPIPQIFGSPANGTVMYCDDVDLVADAAGVTSAGPYVQLGYGTRAVNGIAKAQTAGAEIHVATPGRWAA